MNVYGLFSFVIFFGFFTGDARSGCWRLKKNYLNHMGDLPLDGGEAKKSNDKIQS